MRTNLNAILLKYRNRDKKIFIQIDALSHEDLFKAIKMGKVPTIKKLINKKGFNVYKLFSELPSNTPAAQMKIMYGLKGKIKGFRWYDKDKEEEYSFKTPKTANYWENIGKSESKGELLEDGASYINLYTGGASRSILSLSKMFEANIKTRMKNKELWKFIFLNADLVFRMSYKLIREFFREIYESIAYKIKNKPQRSNISFPYVRLVNNVFLNEIATIGSKLEMDEGYKNIYLTYTAYDEMGHTRGPQTKEAMNTLKAIDNSIKKIFKYACKKGYDIYIFSDHGQTPSVPFKNKYGITLEELITDAVSNKDLKIKEYNTEGEQRSHILKYGLKTILKNATELGYAFLERLSNNILNKKEEKTDENILKEDITVMSSGPYSHLYFKNIKYRLAEDEINKKAPKLLKILREHPGIEFIIIKIDDGYKVINKENEVLLNKEFKIKNIENNKIFKKVFKNFNRTKDEILDGLSEVSTGSGIGDIVIFGALIEKNKIINFENQYGGHGGLGGNQNNPFLITNNKLKKNKGKTISSLYNIFRGNDLE
ncbi:MAG: alkaline phosphatase family protein [Fusobacteriota bacterium]